MTTINKKYCRHYVVIICICYPTIESSISESNIQYSMLVFHKLNTVLLNNKFQVILPTTMLEYFVVHNIFFSDVYMEDTSKMKYQLNHTHLDQYFIQQSIIKYSNIYVSITVYLLWLICISWGRGNSQHSMLANTEYNNISVDNYYQ